MKAQLIFKLTFFIGVCLSFLSLFVDYYSYQGFEDGELVLSWNLNLFFSWTTQLNNQRGYNDLLKPPELEIPIEIHIIFIVLLVGSVFVVLFKDVISAKDYIALRPYVYVLLTFVLFIGFYIFIIPAFYLISNGLYFPIITLSDEDIGIIYFNFINIGYYLQFISFILVFPYVALYFHTVQKYEVDHEDSEKIIKDFLAKENEDLDFDKFIAEEDIRNQFKKMQKNEELKVKTQIIREGGI